MFKKLVIIAFAATSLLACSNDKNKEVEDLQKHQSERAVFSENAEIETQARPEVIQNVMQSLFYINPKSSLIFVQGERKKVYFDVRLAFADLDGLRYTIKMTDGPSDLGARFGSDAKGYYLEWSPRLGIINNQENSKDYKLSVKFELAANSSDATKKELSGQDLNRDYWVTLMKNRAQPIIKNIKYSSIDQTLNANSVGSINFTVEVNGAHKANDISVGPIPVNAEADAPARELVQMSGVPALLGYPKRTSVKTIAPGKVHYNYQIRFDANMMIDHAIRKIEADPILKARLGADRINQAEGVFEVEAYNHDNGMRSQLKKLMYKVNLTPEAAEAVLLGYESVEAEQGSSDRLSFQIVSAGGKGSVEIEKEIPEVEGVNIILECKPSSKLANREIRCYSPNCMLQCRLKAEASCEAKPGVTNIPVKAITQLYENQKESNFTLKVRVKSNPERCAGGGQ